MLPFARLFCLLLLLLTQKVGAQIYADVTVAGSVTGTFTITLEETKAPVTVASFIGLATGEHGWLDIGTGAIRYDGFYNGVNFHRIVKDFVSQVGSRKGDGTDGPGYTFRNEIDSTLHHNAYAVAMANSGKNTNGSQFYITAGAQLFLDGNYTVFGTVTAGQDVCDRINATPVDAGSKPLSPVYIESVAVRGPSLAAFNKSPAGLPRLLDARPVLKKNAALFSLDYEHQVFSEYIRYHSSDLTLWTRLSSNYFGSAGPAGELDVTASALGARHFYRMARVDYSLCSPIEMSGNTIHLSAPFNGAAALNASRTAGVFTFDSDGSTQTITNASLTPQPYSGLLFMRWNNGYQFQLTLSYTTSTSGTFSGSTNVTGLTSVSGTFTVTP